MVKASLTIMHDWKFNMKATPLIEGKQQNMYR